MIFTIYDPPDSSNSKTWGELCVGAIVDVSSWEYETQFCGVGTFELVVPVGAEDVDKLELERFLMCGDGGFIIKQLEFGADEVQVSGYDLNGLLLNRLTVAKTEDGKDKQSGSTEAIVKHYVTANCVSSADAGRNFPGFVVAANQNRGIANDAASPRLQVVGDVISDILSTQKMGWRITAIGTEAGYTGSEKFLFDVISATDRTWNQTANAPVSFSYGLGTVNSMKSEQSSADARNTLYCELADGTVQTYSPTEGNSGYARTEDFASLSCELSELSIYAEHEIADRFAAISNVTIEHIDPTQWGQKIHLGDIVTVYDKHIGLNYNDHTLEALITAVKVKRANGESEISVTIGGTRPKLIDRVSKDVGEVSKNVGDVSGKTNETTAQVTAQLAEQEEQINTLKKTVVLGVERAKKLQTKDFSNSPRYYPSAMQTLNINDIIGKYADTLDGAAGVVLCEDRTGDATNMERARMTVEYRKNEAGFNPIHSMNCITRVRPVNTMLNGYYDEMNFAAYGESLCAQGGFRGYATLSCNGLWVSSDPVNNTTPRYLELFHADYLNSEDKYTISFVIANVQFEIKDDGIHITRPSTTLHSDSGRTVFIPWDT